MEGYLWKRRYYSSGVKKGVLRQRYVILDVEKEVLCFKTTKEEEKIHKHLPLDEIHEVVEYGDHGFILAMRQLATHEACGAAFLFEVGVEGTFEGLNQAQTRELWVEKFKGKVNSANNGLDLVMRNSESIHHRYDILLRSPRSLLGSGMSGDVRLIHRKSDGKPFAMKTVSLSGVSPGRLGALRREIDIMKSLDHPHIARLQETFMEPKLYCRLVIELCEGGELFHRLHQRHYFRERYAGKLITTMLKALNYLHTNNIVHRDLKLENWLFRNKENFAPCENMTEGKKISHCDCSVCEDADLALIDFGLSRRFRSDDEPMIKQVGTCYYVAPEVLTGTYHGNSCDMWSLGVISFMLLSGKAPFDSEKDDEMTKMIRNNPVPDINNPEDPDSIWHRISDSCKDFVQCVLKKNPEERMTTEDALKHPWIEKFLSHEPVDGSVDSTQTVGIVHTIDDSVLQRLRNFAKYKELKRLAMEVIAFSLDHKEIKDLTDLFEKIDTDHDGYITLEELLTALKDYENMEVEEVKVIFEALDEEKNGKVHVNEFVAGALQASYHLDETVLQEAFSRLDVGQKGKVTLEDVQRLLGRCASKERIEKLWVESGLAEKSKTEDISFEHFLMFMKTDGEEQIREFRRESILALKKKKDVKISAVTANSSTELDSLRQKLGVTHKLSRKTTGKSATSITTSTRSIMHLSPIGRVRRIFGVGGMKALHDDPTDRTPSMEPIDEDDANRGAAAI